MNDNNLSLNQFKNILNDCQIEFGFHQIEWGHLKSPITIDFYEKWLQKNFYGSMKYLKDHFEIKKNPNLINPSLQSVISLSQAYFPLEKPISYPSRVALYAQNEDYHIWLKQKLMNVISRLQAEFPSELFLPYVDSGPLLEKDWAYQNQLGWFGKNTCLIHPQHGSLFFIAEILTSYKRPSSEQIEPLPDFCGTCQKCIEICPTKALIAPREMKADQCISYLTIEAKASPPIEFRKSISDWFFGCDLCQTICPWNQKVFRQKKIPMQNSISTETQLNLNPTEQEELIKYFRWLLTASHKQIQKQIQKSPLSRAGAKGLKRNALIVIANRKIQELKSEVEKANLPEFNELKKWTLDQLSN